MLQSKMLLFFKGTEDNIIVSKTIDIISNITKTDSNFIKNIINKLDFLTRIDIKFLKTKTEINDFLIKHFILSLNKDSVIQGSLEELKQHIQIIFKTFSFDLSIQKNLSFFSFPQQSSAIGFKNFGNVITQYLHNYINKITEIWKRVFELLQEFNHSYFQIYILEQQIKITLISIEILEYIIEKMEIMYKLRKIDYTNLINEKNNLFFQKNQLEKLKFDYELKKQQALINGFDLSELCLFQFEELNQYEEEIKSFNEKLNLSKFIDKNGKIYISPKDAYNCLIHQKEMIIPLSAGFSANNNDFSFNFKNINFDLQLSISNLLQMFYNLYTNRMYIIMFELNNNGKINYDNYLKFVMIMEKNLKSLNNLEQEYINGFKNELIKLNINPGNMINVLKYLENNFIQILNNKHKNYAQLYEKHMEMNNILLSIIITFDLLKKYKSISSSNKSDKKNPFK